MKPTPDVLKAIETAIQIEKDGLAFYTEAARQTLRPFDRAQDRLCPSTLLRTSSGQAHHLAGGIRLPDRHRLLV